MSKYMADVTAEDVLSLKEFNTITKEQCPLPPRTFNFMDTSGLASHSHTTAWLYNDHFWIRVQDADTGRPHIYPVQLSSKSCKKFKRRIEFMRTADEFLSSLQLSTSVEIYQSLSSLASDGPKAIDMPMADVQRQQVAQKFVPRRKHRISFLVVILRAMLNMYFIVNNVIMMNEAMEDVAIAMNDYQLFVSVSIGAELLMCVLLAISLLYNVCSLLKGICFGSTTHFQLKHIPQNVRHLASLSLMQYLPNSESVTLFARGRKQWCDAKKASFAFEVENAHSFQLFEYVRWIILTFLDVLGPFLALANLWFKLLQLQTLYHSSGVWNASGLLFYVAFINQVAGIRDVKTIQLRAMEHIVFSRTGTQLSNEEARLLHVWWNYTIVSCVANVCNTFRFPVFDSLVFWYSMNAQRIGLLFKQGKMNEIL